MGRRHRFWVCALAAAVAAVVAGGAGATPAAAAEKLALKLSGGVPGGSLTVTGSNLSKKAQSYTLLYKLKGSKVPALEGVLSLGPPSRKTLASKSPLEDDFAQYLLTFAPAGATEVELKVSLARNNTIEASKRKTIASATIRVPLSRPTLAARVGALSGQELAILDFTVANAPNGDWNVVLRPSNATCADGKPRQTWGTAEVESHAYGPTNRRLLGTPCLDPATAAGQAVFVELVSPGVPFSGGPPFESYQAVASLGPITIEAL